MENMVALFLDVQRKKDSFVVDAVIFSQNYERNMADLRQRSNRYRIVDHVSN